MTARVFKLLANKDANFQEIRAEVKMNNADLLDDQGRTMLMHAAMSSYIGIIADLNKRNVDLDVQDNDGNTALILAVPVADKNAVSLLVTYGAKCMLRNNDGDTALLRAIRRGWDDVVGQMLDAEKPDVYTPDANGKSVLDIAIDCAKADGATKDHIRVVEIVLALYREQEAAFLQERQKKLDNMQRLGMPVAQDVRDEGQIYASRRRKGPAL